MTNTNTYIIETIPYFYIIQHKQTKIMYAGSRWMVGCHPDEFMQHNGYSTSSSTINNIISLEGLESFKILRVDTNLDGLPSFDYETLFLQTLDCANSPYWYNQHNNIGMAFGTEQFYDLMLLKYGCKHVSQIPESQEKRKQTNLKIYGYEYGLQSPIIKEKRNQTNLKIYGYENISSLPDTKVKKSQSSQDKFGFDNISKSPIIKEKKRQSSQDKFGFDTPLQHPEIKEQIKQTNLKNIGYDNHSKRPFLSIIEKQKTYAKNIISKLYPEFKPFY
jgi:hypothetical protein